MNDPASAPRPSLTAEIAGWYGTVAILGAYVLSTFEVLEQGRLYQALNLTGALGIAWVCWRKRTWQAFWLELIWAVVAMIALTRSVWT